MLILSKFPAFLPSQHHPHLTLPAPPQFPPIGISPQEEMLKREYYLLGFRNSFVDTLTCTEAQILDKIFIYKAPKVTVDNWDQTLKVTSLFLTFSGFKMSSYTSFCFLVEQTWVSQPWQYQHIIFVEGCSVHCGMWSCIPGLSPQLRRRSNITCVTIKMSLDIAHVLWRAEPSLLQHHWEFPW